MAGKESKLRNLTERRGSLEIERETIRLELSHLDEEVRLLLEDFRDRNSRDLSDDIDRRSDIDRSSRELKDQLSAAKTELKGLGQVNLMAPEEFAEVSERFDFLTG